LTAVIRKGEKQYVALCPEFDVVSQGLTVESSLENLKEAVELYIEEMGLRAWMFLAPLSLVLLWWRMPKLPNWQQGHKSPR